MKLFQKKRPKTRGQAVQVREGGRHPFGTLEQYVPMQEQQMGLYRAMREAIPILDAAIQKLVRLCGGVSVVCQEKGAQKAMDRFLKTVPTGRGQRGLQSFLDGYVDCLLTCGRAVGEIVPDGEGRTVAAVLWCDPRNVEIRQGDNPLDFTLCQPGGGVEAKPYPCQQLLLFTPFQPETGNPYGVSLLRSMPFMAEILMKIYQAVGTNWGRLGNARFAVICKDADDGTDAEQRCAQVAQEWSRAMQESRQGSVRDFVAMGDVEIRVIGADNPMPDTEVPVRQILEQLIARTGIPPFMLGLSWSSTERMSSQQADLMTSEITAIRRSVEPAIERICETWLRLNGWGGSVDVEWADINLQDEVEQARAALYRRQAEERKGDGES